MKDKRSAHLKLQELVDCFVSTDPLAEMTAISGNEPDREEAALKWMALAAIHGVTARAKKISLKKDANGNVTVKAKYRTSPLPSPDAALGHDVVTAVKELIQADGSKGKSDLALGIRDSSIDLKIKFKQEDDGEKCSIVFPE